MDHQHSLYLFDVDGVLTDEFARVDACAISLAAGLVARGNPVAFITGRSARWLDEHLMDILLAALPRPTRRVPEPLFCAEMGAVRRVGFDGDWQRDNGLAVPAYVREGLRQRSQDPAHMRWVGWDNSKTVTATVEARHRPGDHAFARRAREVLHVIGEEVGGLAADEECVVSISTYALDVHRANLSKGIGATAALARFTASGTVNQVLVFGDSCGDLAMAQAAVGAHGLRVRFHWLGLGEAPPSADFEVVAADKPFAAGTRLLLQGSSEG